MSISIGLLHANVGTIGIMNCILLHLPDLISHQFDYWALGHIHANKSLIVYRVVRRV